MIEWGRVPWSLWLYVLPSVALSGWFVFQVSGPITAQVLFSAIVLMWAFFLLRGVRWLWIATVAVGVLSFISGLIIGPQTWYGIAGGAISIGLLLVPPRAATSPASRWQRTPRFSESPCTILIP